MCSVCVGRARGVCAGVCHRKKPVCPHVSAEKNPCVRIWASGLVFHFYMVHSWNGTKKTNNELNKCAFDCIAFSGMGMCG